MNRVLLLGFLSLICSVALPQSNQWTWVKGDNSLPQLPFYGKRGIASPDNKPGLRQYAASFTTSTGDMWLFGGYGPAYSRSVNGSGYLNDLWRYSPATGLSTWMNGDTLVYQPANFGTMGIAVSTNKPGARQSAVSWTDATGAFWLFGGRGDTEDDSGYLNDLWSYIIPSTSLPIRFSFFTAQKLTQAVSLKWQTSQIASSYFIIERSSDGTLYDSIGIVSAATSNSLVNQYSYTDISPGRSTHFYRLKQVEQDGSFFYSAVVKVIDAGEASQFRILQNPIKEILQLLIQQSQDDGFTLQITDMYGRLLIDRNYPGNPSRSIYSLLTSGLPNGIYSISMHTKKISFARMFVIQ